MRWFCLCLGLWWMLPAQAEGIAAVLQRSQQARLVQRGPAVEPLGEAAQRVRASLDRLVTLLPVGTSVELMLVGGDLFAEADFGHSRVAASQAVGELPEGERLLMLAHELGHLQLGHWGALSGLYQGLIPGEVRPETTEPVAAELSAQAHALSHRQEFEADAFGYGLVHQLGFGLDNAFALLTRHGMQQDNATHPGTRRRLAQIRALDAHLDPAVRYAGEASAVAAATTLPR